MVDILYNSTVRHSPSLIQPFTALRGRSSQCGATPGYVWLFASIELIEDIIADIEQGWGAPKQTASVKLILQ